MDKIVDQSGPHVGGLPKMKSCPKNAPSDMQIAQNWQFGGLNRRLSYFLNYRTRVRSLAMLVSN